MNFITKDDKLLNLIASIGKLKNDKVPILITGETGTGKEVLANIIFSQSHRTKNPFIKVGLATISESLFESELFGHERGAFTDAHNRRKGLLESADGGTVFLDDIDDCPVQIQAKLLRAIEVGEVRSVGSDKTQIVDFRALAATKVDLEQLSALGKFRVDLFHRLNAVPIFLPPLRDRRGDVVLLLQHFLKQYNPEGNYNVSDEAAKVLLDYHWPGNVRELKNIAYRITLQGGEDIQPDNISLDATKRIKSKTTASVLNGFWRDDLKTTMHDIEKQFIEMAIESAGGVHSHAAKALGIPNTTLQDKLKKYDLP